jgi:hypothetical protein
MNDGAIKQKNKLVEYQNKFKTNVQIIKKIQSILNDQQSIIIDQQTKQFELLQKMVENNVQMKRFYHKLEKPISLVQKKLLYQIYKNEKNPPTTRLKDLEKEMKIPVKEIENWLEYFKSFEKYMNTQRDITNLSQEISGQLKHYQIKNNNFFLSNESINILPGSGSKRPRATTARRRTTVKPNRLPGPNIIVKTETDSNVINIKTTPTPAPAPTSTPAPVQANTIAAAAPVPAPAQSPPVVKRKITIKKQTGGFSQNQKQMIQKNHVMNNNNNNNNKNSKNKKVTDSYDFLDLLNNSSSEKLLQKKNVIDIDANNSNNANNVQNNQNIPVEQHIQQQQQIKSIDIVLNDHSGQTPSPSASIQNYSQNRKNVNQGDQQIDQEQYREIVFH